MKVDVVLLTKNSVQPCLGKCVASIYKNVPINKLIVVDGGSTDGTLGFLGKFPDVELIDDSRGNRATARQRGINAVETEWHMHVDSDCILSDDWFKNAWSLVDDNVGALWGVDIPVEKHFFNIEYANAKLQRIEQRLINQKRSEHSISDRFMTHDTLIRTAAVKGIAIPKDLHIWEDEYIGRYIIRGGYRFLRVKKPFCLHNLTANERFYGFMLSGYLSRKYKLETFQQVFRHVVFAFPKSIWIFMTTRDFEAAKIYFKKQVLVLKGWLVGKSALSSSMG
jgi:glycosyltransferase involved in cell wall biosynthesis